MNATELHKQVHLWMESDPDEGSIAELRALLAKNETNELTDRFRGPLEFGTAGLRGVIGAGPNRMNRAVVRRTTAGLARYLKAHVPDAASRGVVVGRDGRRMSAEFAEDVAGVLAAEGIRALVFKDMVPTPVTAFALLAEKACAAVMVTASHNPPEYNGYKVYWGNGAQIVPPHDVGIAASIEAVGPANEVGLLSPTAARAAGLWVDLGAELEDAYLKAIDGLRVFPQGPKDFTLVYTAMHGVGGRFVERAFRAAGFTSVHPVKEQHHPDGAFPTVRFPNPEEPGAMDLSIARAREVNAVVIIANDPDADRLAIVARTASGEYKALTGNEVGVLLGHYLLTQGKASRRPHVVTTIVSSAQLGVIARDLGAAYDETLTGFKWVSNRALSRKAAEGVEFVFGYEEALGYTVGELVRDKDGVSAALVFADLVSWCRASGLTLFDYLEDIQRRHGLFVSSQRNFTLPGAEGAATIRSIMDAFRRSPPDRVGKLGVKEVRDYKPGFGALPPSDVIALLLEGDARITLRPSGTEPKIKFYFELKESLRGDEKAGEAQARGEAELKALEEALLSAARERGMKNV